MSMENVMVKILDESGNLVEHKILFTFECEELGKHYLAYEGQGINEIPHGDKRPDHHLG